MWIPGQYIPGHWELECEEIPVFVPKEGCQAKMYVLRGNGTCSLVINRELGDVNKQLPVRYVDNGKLTTLGQATCNECRTTPFNWNGDWYITCKEPCVNCQ